MDSILTFPCEFSLKIIGSSEVNLEFIVIPILTQNNVDIERTHISTNVSSAGKYSLTVSIWATSQEQLDGIYRQLSSHPQVIMAL
jgi:putative lipoic acid-binding regulatory protein